MSSSPPHSPKKSSDVVSRLTDPKKYTGAHKARFDGDGKGRGLAGRVDIVDFKGNTNTPTVHSTSDKEGKKPVVKSPLGKEKFGTQASKAPTITLFRNGDKHHKGEVYTVKLVKTLDQLLDKASTLVKLPTGAVRKIYKSNMKSSVKGVDDLEDGGIYLCCGGEKPLEADKQSADFIEKAKDRAAEKAAVKEIDNKEKEKDAGAPSSEATE